MQEIKKRRILIASVLKPVDEPRAFGKIGQSLASDGFEVFITGFPASSSPTSVGITFLPLPRFKRISFSRLIARLAILRNAFRLKPDLLIIGTHELLDVALLYRLFTGRQTVYDVQENYFKNILYTHAFPTLLRPLVAGLVRLKESIVSYFLSGFILAEKCYQNELPFLKGKVAVIENKCNVPTGFQRNVNPNDTLLIFTGTLAESTGVFKAIELTKQLHAIDVKITLEILGFCPLPQVLQQIKHQIEGCSFISLKGGDHFLPHSEVFEAISRAHFGIVSYPLQNHTKDRIPTKLYEYLACGLPILLATNPLWEKMIGKEASFISLDFAKPDSREILSKMAVTRAFIPAKDAQWATEEARLLSFVKNLGLPQR